MASFEWAWLRWIVWSIKKTLWVYGRRILHVMCLYVYCVRSTDLRVLFLLFVQLIHTLLSGYLFCIWAVAADITSELSIWYSRHWAGDQKANSTMKHSHSANEMAWTIYGICGILINFAYFFPSLVIFFEKSFFLPIFSLFCVISLLNLSISISSTPITSALLRYSVCISFPISVGSFI